VLRLSTRLLIVLSVTAGSVAWGAGSTEIASSFDEGNESGTFHSFFIGVDYEFDAKSASIKREDAGTTVGGTPDGAEPVVKDLIYSESRHTLTPHVQIGIFHDFELRVGLPIILGDTRSLEFDQRASPCVFPGGSDPPTCINKMNSTTLRDGLLPDGSAGMLGYDADNPTVNFNPDATQVFRGVNRSGLDTVNLGLSVAPMNQARDDTKPTWVIGAEVDLSVGKIAKFNRFKPGEEDGVSTGVHWFKAMTSISKRTSWAEPFITFWWMAPIGERGNTPEDPNGSLFWNVGYGQKNHDPQQQAGTTFGFEAIAFENKKDKQRLAIELQGHVNAHFEGYGYSELWEVFAYAGDKVNNPGGPLVLDSNPTTAAVEAMSYPGTTQIENYMTFGGRVGLRAQIGDHVKFSAGLDVQDDQSHVITFDDAGIDRPGCTAMITTNCESPDDNVVTPGTIEVNPLHKQLINLPGRRFIVDGATTFTFLVSSTIIF
jgi:hypothetical protein